ncbi:hypothetical protein ZOSMA_168G00130 [Zostera marina]|uniref:Protein kinase domain-containing protein n=1 Tax=Zostera marina TaxID=29655 RepID=A0A0K9PVK2_ZOSMR|nr:hypothetical protein ZOSMA_168G00130 [Zostera marina]
MYSLEDLLKASAEMLGRGTVGSTYKAVMESGFIVTVKRLKDSGYPGLEEFRRRMEVLGRLRHPELFVWIYIKLLYRNCSITMGTGTE